MIFAKTKSIPYNELNFTNGKGILKIVLFQSLRNVLLLINAVKKILYAFKYVLTNGPTEGFNYKLKVLKRISYGIRNFKRFRTHILHLYN